MNNSPKAGFLHLDRFTVAWLALVGLLVAAALGTTLVKGNRGSSDPIPAYSEGDTAEDFVYNAYLAHLRGDLVRLQSMYTADAWAEIHDEEKNWSESGLFTGSSILGLHILEAIDGPDGAQARVASYYTRRDGPLGIQRVEVNTELIPLVSTGEGWKLQQLLPRYWY